MVDLWDRPSQDHTEGQTPRSIFAAKLVSELLSNNGALDGTVHGQHHSHIGRSVIQIQKSCTHLTTFGPLTICSWMFTFGMTWISMLTIAPFKSALLGRFASPPKTRQEIQPKTDRLERWGVQGLLKCTLESDLTKSGVDRRGPGGTGPARDLRHTASQMEAACSPHRPAECLRGLR